ncbi:hypothetical protein GCM10023114_58310 [Mycolicibacterium sediminis]|uniref:Uncharacterized protein n=1 Tax=Mycolicibacterium sediminis TaxID=1286180 RepID=A0A7I7QP29_9MYCO|nr:hypothetical protein MSEDJ_22450 [Mycolicibacterium sediminis]
MHRQVGLTQARISASETSRIGASPIVLDASRKTDVYERIIELAPGFGEYEKRTDRVIPVFELTPTA